MMDGVLANDSAVMAMSSRVVEVSFHIKRYSAG